MPSIERVGELLLPLETAGASRFTRSAVDVPVEPDAPGLFMPLPVAVPVAAASRFARSVVMVPVVPVAPLVPVVLVPMLSAARGTVEFGVVDVDGLTAWPFVWASVPVEDVVLGVVVVCANAKLAAAAAAQINSLGDFMRILLKGEWEQIG